MNRLIVTAALLIAAAHFSYAQDDSLKTHRSSFDRYRERAESEFDRYTQKREEDFEAYRQKVDRQFAIFVARSWKSYEVSPAVPRPECPDPPELPIFNPDDILPDGIPVPYDTVITVPDPHDMPRPEPLVPFEEQEPAPVEKSVAFELYGTPCSVRIPDAPAPHLGSTDEKSVSEWWTETASGAYDVTVSDCLSLREELRLCDWAYLRLAGMFASSYHDDWNDAVLMQFFIMVKSGYKVRLAKADDSFVILAPAQQGIVGMRYLQLGGAAYYIVEEKSPAPSYQICDCEYPGEKLMSLYLMLPNLEPSPKSLGAFSVPDGQGGNRQVNLSSDSNLFAFLDDYPHGGNWEVMSAASLSDRLKAGLYPVLKESLRGKSPAEGAELLLHFVQRSFSYMTDQEQFGYERALFCDETFRFPYSDCEDRAILYSALVRDLLGLDVVLLYYPDHLATAVLFDEDVPGDYLMVDGRRFTVCDPTFIGAGIGRAMPQYRNVAAQVIRIAAAPHTPGVQAAP